jgi:hypothetical protein
MNNIKLRTEMYSYILKKCEYLNLKKYEICAHCIAAQYNCYIKFLNNVLNECDERGYYDGIIFYNDMDKSDDPNFKLNNICFFLHDCENILTYSEAYEYITIASNFYIELHPEHKEEVIAILEKIKAKYLD